MRKQRGLPLGYPPQPEYRFSEMTTQLLELSHCPPDQYIIQVTQGRIQGRLVKARIVVDPAPDYGTEQTVLQTWFIDFRISNAIQ